MTDQNPAGSERDHFIPVRRSAGLDAVIADGALVDDAERGKFRQLCKLLGAIYHYEYFDRLEKLRNDYFYFSPELDAAHARFDADTLERAYAELIATLRSVLHNANFIEIPHDEINRAHREH